MQAETLHTTTVQLVSRQFQLEATFDKSQENQQLDVPSGNKLILYFNCTKSNATADAENQNINDNTGF